MVYTVPMKRILDAWFLRRTGTHLFIQVVFLIVYEDFVTEDANAILKYGSLVLLFIATEFTQRSIEKRQIVNQQNARTADPALFERNQRSPLVIGFFLFFNLVLLLVYLPLLIG